MVNAISSSGTQRNPHLQERTERKSLHKNHVKMQSKKSRNNQKKKQMTKLTLDLPVLKSRPFNFQIIQMKR